MLNAVSCKGADMNHCPHLFSSPDTVLSLGIPYLYTPNTVISSHQRGPHENLTLGCSKRAFYAIYPARISAYAYASVTGLILPFVLTFVSWPRKLSWLAHGHFPRQYALLQSTSCCLHNAAVCFTTRFFFFADLSDDRQKALCNAKPCRLARLLVPHHTIYHLSFNLELGQIFCYDWLEQRDKEGHCTPLKSPHYQSHTGAVVKYLPSISRYRSSSQFMAL